jgi:NADPH:quinone reductase
MTTKPKHTQVIRFDSYGDPGVLKLEDVPLEEPREDEVRIRIEAMSLNRADALFRSNKYVLKPSFPESRIGTDAAGIIDAVGPAVNGLNVGDRVITGLGFDMSKFGTHGETAILPQRFVHRYPDFLSPAEAASVNNPYLTAWGALIDQGALTNEDHVVITAASSSVGVAAIQLARAVGATPIAVTRSKEKREALLRIGASHVIDTGFENLAERVGSITNGRGARLIFDAVGETLNVIGDVAAEGGIVFLYGAFDLSPTTLPIIPAITKELRLWGYMVYSVHSSPERLKRALDYVFDTMRVTGIRPVIDREFKLDEYAKAHEYLESNLQVGRVVVIV